MINKQVYRDWRKSVNNDVPNSERLVKLGSKFYNSFCLPNSKVIKYEYVGDVWNRKIGRVIRRASKVKSSASKPVKSEIKSWKSLCKDWKSSKEINYGCGIGEKGTYKQAKRGYDIDNISEKRIYRMVDVMISKIAEDLTGYDTYGEDFWDIDRLMGRKLNKYPLSSCTNSRDREKLIFIVDTSPSCVTQSKFYSKLAMAAAKRQDVEIYDAPNALIEKIYNPKTEKWDSCIVDNYIYKNSEELVNENDWDIRWNNRTIIFFGDWDGNRIIGNGSRNNKVYFFCNSENYGYSDWEMRKYIRDERFIGKHYICNSDKDFINIMRKIR